MPVSTSDIATDLVEAAELAERTPPRGEDIPPHAQAAAAKAIVLTELRLLEPELRDKGLDPRSPEDDPKAIANFEARLGDRIARLRPPERNDIALFDDDESVLIIAKMSFVHPRYRKVASRPRGAIALGILSAEWLCGYSSFPELRNSEMRRMGRLPVSEVTSDTARRFIRYLVDGVRYTTG